MGRTTKLRSGAVIEDTIEDRDGDTSVKVEPSPDADTIEFSCGGVAVAKMTDSVVDVAQDFSHPPRVVYYELSTDFGYTSSGGTITEPVSNWHKPLFPSGNQYYDRGNFVSYSSVNSEFEFLEAGVYRVSLNIDFEPAGSRSKYYFDLDGSVVGQDYVLLNSSRYPQTFATQVIEVTNVSDTDAADNIFRIAVRWDGGRFITDGTLLEIQKIK